MHKVYENDDLLMYFKKRYCHCCGKALQRKTTERIVHKGDPEHREYCTIGRGYKLHGDILIIGQEYFCPYCNKSFSCEEQGEVIEAQKHYQRHIVSKEEICNVKNSNMEIANNIILKMRWLLLIPVIGVIICTFKIFNGCLQEKTNNGDLHKLTMSSLLVFIGVAIAIKLVLSVVNNDFLTEHQTLFMLIPSLLSSNMPTLWYINHMFKSK